MGVYLCLGQPIHCAVQEEPLDISNFKTFEAVHQYVSQYGKIFLFLGKGQHQIKRKAEQIACNEALKVYATDL